MFASGPPHHFVNKFHNNRLLSGGWNCIHTFVNTYPYNRQTNIHAVRTSGEKFISSLHCVVKKEKSKRVPELGGRELTDLSPDVLTA